MKRTLIENIPNLGITILLAVLVYGVGHVYGQGHPNETKDNYICRFVQSLVSSNIDGNYQGAA